MKNSNDLYVHNLVSVIIPTYKRSDMLSRAIDSVCNQKYTNLEIIIVNDNSREDKYSNMLYNLMEKYSFDKRVKLIEQEKHINGAVARNVGIKAAHGEYLSFLDDDDWWEPEKIEHQKKYLDTLDDSWCGVGCLMKHYKGNKLSYVSLPYKEGSLMFAVMTRQVGIGTGSPLLRRKAVDDAGYFDETLLRHQDIQFFSYLCSKYKMGLLKEYLYSYDLEDSQNRPLPENIVKIKKEFYRSINVLINDLPKRKKKALFVYNNFEIGVAFIRNKQYKLGIHYIKGSILRPFILLSCFKRIINRKKGTILKKYYLKKYRIK